MSLCGSWRSLRQESRSFVTSLAIVWVGLRIAAGRDESDKEVIRVGQAHDPAIRALKKFAKLILLVVFGDLLGRMADPSVVIVEDDRHQIMLHFLPVISASEFGCGRDMAADEAKDERFLIADHGPIVGEVEARIRSECRVMDLVVNLVALV